MCVRYRETQTLYVSDIIQPSKCTNPGYGKLHVGIYVAAIQETMDRKRQQRQQQLSQTNLPGGACGNKNDEDRDRGGFQGSAGKMGPTDAIEVCWLNNINVMTFLMITRAIHIASNRDVIFLYLKYNIYDSPVPASFLRSAPPIITHKNFPIPAFHPRAIDNYKPEECLTVILTSEIGQGATGVVLRGTLEPEILDCAMPLDIVVKLAFDFEQRDAFRSEYEVYRHLRLKGVEGIATTLGFFNDFEGAACVLVMLYAGVSLSIESQGDLSISDQ